MPESRYEQHMTIETLAEIINEGFNTTASKEDINRVEVRMGGIESRCGRMETPRQRYP